MAGKKFSITAIIGVNSSMMARGLAKAGAKMKAWAKRSMAMVRAAVKTGVLLAGAAMAIFASKSVKEFASFEKGMLEVFTLMPGMTKAAMSAMESDVLKLAKTMGILPAEVVPALYQALSAGVPKENVMSFLGVATRAAIGGAVDLETAVNGLTGVINAYGKENISATKASDIMFLAVRLGKTTFLEMSKSLGDATPLAAALGISFGELAAALATSTSITGNTAKSITGLKSLMGELGKSGMFAARNFEAISGKSFPDFIKAGGTMQQALKMMKQRADQTGGSIMDMFGGMEAGQMALQLTESGANAFAAATRAMGNEAGTTQAQFATMDKGLARSFSKISSAFRVVMVRFGKALAPLVEKITPVIMKIISQIDSINWAALINGFARVWVIGLKPTFDAVKKAIMGLPWGKLGEFLLPVAGLVIKTIQKLGKIIVGLAPMLIPAIESLVGYFVVLYKNIFLVIHFLSKVAKDVGLVFKDVFQIVSAAMAFIIDPTKAKFQNLIDTLKRNFGSLGGNLKNLFHTIWKGIKEKFGDIVKMIIGGFKHLVSAGGAALQEWMSKIPGLTDAIASISRIFKMIKHEIGGEIAALVGAFKDMRGAVGDNVKGTSVFKKAIDYLSGSFGEILVQLVKFIGNMMKIVALVYTVIIRLATQLAPTLSVVLPLAFKVAGAAVFFLIEGIKVIMLYVNYLIQTILFLKPAIMVIVDAISGFIHILALQLKTAWAIFSWLYDNIKLQLGRTAEAWVTAFYKVKNATKSVIDFIISLFRKLKDFVYWILFGGTITKDFKEAFELIEKIVSKVLDTIFKIFKTFKEVARTVLEGIAVVFQTIFDGIGKVVETLGDIVVKVFESIGKQIKGILNAFTSMAKIIEGIFGKVLELGGKALNLAGKVVGGASGLLKSAAGKLGFGGGGGAKGASVSSGRITTGSLRTSLKPIVSKLSSMDTTLKSIDRTLKGKFVNQ